MSRSAFRRVPTFAHSPATWGVRWIPLRTSEGCGAAGRGPPTWLMRTSLRQIESAENPAALFADPAAVLGLVTVELSPGDAARVGHGSKLDAADCGAMGFEPSQNLAITTMAYCSACMLAWTVNSRRR